MKFPFPITEEIRNAYQAHVDYVSAGQKWLLKNDPDAYNEQVLLEAIQTAITDAAEEHFGDDLEALEVFLDEIEITGYTGGWYDILEAELESA